MIWHEDVHAALKLLLRGLEPTLGIFGLYPFFLFTFSELNTWVSHLVNSLKNRVPPKMHLVLIPSATRGLRLILLVTLFA